MMSQFKLTSENMDLTDSWQDSLDTGSSHRKASVNTNAEETQTYILALNGIRPHDHSTRSATVIRRNMYLSVIDF
jgi:hypothetical protein